MAEQIEGQAGVKLRVRRIQLLRHFIVHRKLGSQVSTIKEKFMTVDWLHIPPGPSAARSGLGIFILNIADSEDQLGPSVYPLLFLVACVTLRRTFNRNLNVISPATVPVLSRRMVS